MPPLNHRSKTVQKRLNAIVKYMKEYSELNNQPASLGLIWEFLEYKFKMDIGKSTVLYYLQLLVADKRLIKRTGTIPAYILNNQSTANDSK